MKNKTTMAIILGIILSLNAVSALTIDSVQTSKTDIQPGDRVSIRLDIENNLDSDADNVVVSLDLSMVPFAPYESSNQIMKDEVEEGESRNFEFELIADSDASSGTYKIPVNIDYEISDEVKTSSGLVSLIISARPQLDVSIEEAFVIKGRTSEISVRVVNSGLGEARLLSLNLQGVGGLKLLSGGSVYIGNIDSDDFDNADFTISADGTAPGTINLPVEIVYRDSKNKEIRETKFVSLKTYSHDEAVALGLASKSNTMTYVIVIVVLLVLWFIYRSWKKRRKRRA